MEDNLLPTIEQHFEDLTDPRIDRTQLHGLINILVIALCAVIAEPIAGKMLRRLVRSG